MSGFANLIDPVDEGSHFNATRRIIDGVLNGIDTATIVKVVTVTNSGTDTPVGYVDVLPLVNQINGAGLPTPHSAVFGLPYVRVQGGANAIIIDPVVGDIGIAIFANRDITAVKNTAKQANPGSRRTFSMSDGMYIGGLLNGTPTQYVQFVGNNINVVSPGTVTITAPTINLMGNVNTTGTLTNNGHAVGSTHEHSSVQPGSGTSGPPV